MSGSGTADRTARWRPSRSPRSTIRRTVVVTAASLSSLALLVLPALAAATIAPAEVTADSDVELTVTVTEPDGESHPDYGDTTRVVVTAPSGFTNLACRDDSTPVGWNCAAAEDGTRVTYARAPSPVALPTSRDFGVTVHTPKINGTYQFTVTQADGPPPAEGEVPPDTVTTRPAVAVTGGQEPKPDPSPSPESGGTSGNGGSSTSDEDSTGDGTTDGGSTSGEATSSDASPEPTTTDTGPGDGDDSTSTGTSDDGSTGSTAPRRTQGRASGTTLEISPGEPAGDDPAIAPPDVAGDPAVAPPDDGSTRQADDTAAVTASGARPGQGPGGGPPWQQLVGAAMLLVGGAVVAIRRWDLVGRIGALEPVAQLRRWRSN